VESVYDQYLLDLGSNTIKLYRVNESQLLLEDSFSWHLLGNGHNAVEIERIILAITADARSKKGHIIAVGTEALRRLEARRQVERLCSEHGIRLVILSQEKEAELIRRAAARSQIPLGTHIVNAGGGSVQVVHTDGTMSLLAFGLVELTQRFSLLAPPGQRRPMECRRWILERLPEMQGVFAYTGGERAYLVALDVPVEPDGYCLIRHFEAMADRLESLSVQELERLSPFDPGWMQCAIASNCLVLALLAKSGARTFVASDLDICHGLLTEAIAS
jgi:hypothetical protein